MTVDLGWLVLAGVGAGLAGSMAGLASLVSFPALLAFGLPPLAANVTNTVALMGSTVGSAAGSVRELTGLRRRVLVVVGQSVLGGLAGAVLLLSTPSKAFEVVVPWLVALGALLLLLRDPLRSWAVSRRERVGGGAGWQRWLWPVAVVLAGVYAGYFGAGAGVILLALLAVRHTEPLAVTNAVKNLGTGAGNAAAAVVYAVVAPVDWPAVLALGVGAVAGSWLGPQVVRVLPEKPLRYAIAVAGFGLAAYLAFG